MEQHSRREKRAASAQPQGGFGADADYFRPGRKATRNGATVFAVAIFILAFLIVLALASLIFGEIGAGAIGIALVVGVLAATSEHIALDWERAVVLRFGKFSRVAGPGLFFTIPIIEYVPLRVDQRVMCTPFSAEETLTSDLVPLNVDAVLFWMVWDAKKACTEVEDYSRAVSWVAQTTMRDAIGRASVAEVAIRRNQLDRELQKTIEESTEPWGITIMSVRVRDIVVPKDLQDAMSLEAQVDRERNARVMRAEVEQVIADMLVGAGEMYEGHDKAFQLRTMGFVYESVKSTGGTVVIPSAFSEGFKNMSPEDIVKLAGK